MNFNNISAAIATLRRLNPEYARREKMFELFQKNNRLVSLESGERVTVLDANEGGATLVMEDGMPIFLDWRVSPGQINTAIADLWHKLT